MGFHEQRITLGINRRHIFDFSNASEVFSLIEYLIIYYIVVSL